MLNELPQDQANLILDRLGEARIQRITEEASSVSAFYKLCIREMGSMQSNGHAARIPTKTAAWIEVMNHKLEDDMPEFSHRYIEKAIMSFGGWQQALAVFKRSDLEKAKYKFQFAYEDVVNE
jgi:hypothetical protein